MTDPTTRDILRRLAVLEQKASKVGGGEVGPTIGEVYGTFLGIPFLRAFWPFSSSNDSNAVQDLSGQGRVLSNQVGAQGSIINSVTPTWLFNGTTGYVNRTNETGLQFGTSMTIGGWFNATAFPGAGNTRTLMSKTDAATNIAYLLYENNNGGLLTASISSTGAAGGVVTVTSSNAYTLNNWYFAAMSFAANTSLNIYLNYNGVSGKTSNLAGIPATIFATGTAPFNIGSQNNGAASFFQGNAALCFLSGATLSDTLLAYLFRRTRVLFGV